MAVLSIPVTMDKPRNLRFGIEAMVAIEERYNKSFLEIAQECLGKNPKITTLRDMLWAGLKHEDPNLTPEKVSSIMDETPSIPDVLVAIDKAITAALSEKKDDKKKLGNLLNRLKNM
jgi:hypothetical protein